jgi:hypothetical protein
VNRDRCHHLRCATQIVSLIFICGLAAGCGLYTAVRLTVNDPITPQDVSFIEPGKTGFIQVVERLGSPDELTGDHHGALISYHFRDAKYSRVNLGWPLRFWLPVQPDLILAGGGLGTDMFQVSFDERWVVQHHAFSKHAQASRHRLWPF